MIIKNLRIILTTIGVIALVIGIGLAVSMPQTASALSDVTIENEYDLGRQFTIPKATISYGGKNYDTTATLTYPDGVTYTGENFSLSKSGNYTICYQTTVNGKVLQEQVSFKVKDGLYSLSGNKSSVYYGSDDIYAKDRRGLVLDLAKGEKFTYNKIIDFSGRTSSENLFEFFLTPSYLDQADVVELHVRFTDFYDQSKYIEVKYFKGSDVKNTSLLAGASNQKMSALSNYSWKGPDYLGPADKFVDYEGEWLWLFYEPKAWGRETSGISWISHYASADDIGRQTLGISFNSEKKQIIANYCGLSAVVTDLDCPDIVGNDIFEGFTTGETIMSVWGEGYTGHNLGMVVTDIDGDDLSQSGFIQEENTIIEVDTLGYEQVPFGIVGCPYNIFDAKVSYPITETNKRPAVVRVFSNYKNTNKVSVPITNGTFIPTVKGLYTIEYSVVNRFGKKNVATVDVNVKADEQTPLTVTLGEKTQTAVLFHKTPLPDCEILGASGVANVAVSVISPSGKIQYIDFDQREFTPVEKDEYTVKYTVSDYVRSKEICYTVEVEEQQKVAIIDDAVLPPSYAQGETYAVPELNGYAYDGGTVTVRQTKAYAVYDCNCIGECVCTRTLVSDQIEITANKKVSLIYAVDANGETAEKRYDIPVTVLKNNGIFNMQGYFYTDTPYEFDKGDMSYRVNGLPANSDVSLQFIQPLSVWDFTMVFGMKEEGYQRAQVILRDCEDSEKQLQLTFTRLSDSTCGVQLNGGSVYSFACNPNGNISIGYTDQNKTIIIQNDITLTAEKTAKGAEFNGFTGKKADLLVLMKEINGNASVRIESVNRQKLAGNKIDLIKPSVYYDGIIENKKYALSEVLKIIPEIYACDVLDLSPTLSLIAYTPSGEIATSVDGVKLDGTQPLGKEYYVQAKEYGRYLLEIKCFDGRNTADHTIAFFVADTKSPELTLSKATKECKAGSLVKLAGISVSDNASERKNCQVSVYLIAPDGEITELIRSEDGIIPATAVTLKQKGNYSVLYSVYDEAGNLAETSYEIRVN